MEGIQETTSRGWHIVAAKATGTSHRRAEKGCDDHFGLLTLESGIQLIAVADGAGSAACGSAGAKVAVETALKALESLLANKESPSTKDAWINVMDSVLVQVRNAIAAQASQAPDAEPGSFMEKPQSISIPVAMTLRDFAATLLLAILSPNWISILQLGDGMVVFKVTSGEYYCPVVCTSDGQYINVTHFITDSDYDKWVQIVATNRPDVQGVALLTDGLQLLASRLANREPHPPFFKPLFAFAARESANDMELQTFLDSKRVNARTDDDKTLVIAVRI